jgi:hypothetical protein
MVYDEGIRQDGEDRFTPYILEFCLSKIINENNNYLIFLPRFFIKEGKISILQPADQDTVV